MGAFNKVHDKTTQFLIHTHRFLSIICILFICLQFWNEKNTTWDFQLCNRVSVDTVLWIPEENFPNNQHRDRLLFLGAKIPFYFTDFTSKWSRSKKTGLNMLATIKTYHNSNFNPSQTKIRKARSSKTLWLVSRRNLPKTKVKSCV